MNEYQYIRKKQKDVVVYKDEKVLIFIIKTIRNTRKILSKFIIFVKWCLRSSKKHKIPWYWYKKMNGI